jgi:SpoVK/Ycf46/Vps4 family AAA+-type ATPase
VRGGSRADRRDEVKAVVAELGLDDGLAVHLSKYYELGSQQIRSAARLVNLLEKKDPEASQLLIRTVENSQKALGRDKVEELRDSVTKYDLNLLNISGRFPPLKIIEALKKRSYGTLCFYGLPGTGKTQLAEYMAMQLDLPLLIKRASDILSMWLGENEQNIKKMFEEARSEGAILLLDEADSFLRDRAMARASWDVTMVNELLTQMERFNGIFICATNLFEQLDAAALRRFTFKLQFHPLSEPQRVLMFKNETGIELAHPEERWMQLMQMKFLTPGDFATVKRQANLLGVELTPEIWLEQLEIEARAKLMGVSSRYSNDDLVREVMDKARDK